MKKIIATGIIGSLLMGSSTTLANFDNYVPKTKNIPANGILSVTLCKIEDTKNAPKELISECNGEYIETVGTGTLISEEDMKKMEKMSPKEQMEYLDVKYPSKLPDNLGKLESSGVIEASSKDVQQGVILKIDEFYQKNIRSLSEEKQTKVFERMKAKLESKVKSTKSKKKAQAYQNILSHIQANWSTK